MDYTYIGCWEIWKRFLCVWFLLFSGFVCLSLMHWWDEIVALIGSNMWALFNSVMPLALMVFMLFHLLGLLFR